MLRRGGTWPVGEGWNGVLVGGDRDGGMDVWHWAGDKLLGGGLGLDGMVSVLWETGCDSMGMCCEKIMIG